MVVSSLDPVAITRGDIETEQDFRDVVTGGITAAPPGEKHGTNAVVFSSDVVQMQECAVLM